MQHPSPINNPDRREAPGSAGSEMNILPTATRAAQWGAYLGLACGVLYAVGGLVSDLRTTGLNWGTAMAFMALVGMPAAFGAVGFLCGTLVGLVTRSET